MRVLPSFSVLVVLVLAACSDERRERGSGQPFADGGESDEAGETAGSGGDSPRLDVGTGETEGGHPGDCSGGPGVGDLEFSFLWAANTGEGTVSKIDTEAIAEVARYRTHADWGSPSRTSVGLGADVAVGNRSGSVIKIWADVADCLDQNGVPGIQTSSGKADVLAWGQDDCLAWYTEIPRGMLRPVQWSPGTLDEQSCAYLDQDVWTTGANAGHNGSVLVAVLDGETGEIAHQVPIPEVSVGYYGPYGAAFDTEGDYWFVDSGNDGGGQELVRVRHDDLSYDLWHTPPDYYPYGFTVDSQGRPWMAGWQGGIARFDPDTETFAINPQFNGIGMQDDGKGRMWVVHYPYTWTGVIAFDLETLAVSEMIPAQEAISARGLSFDFRGKMWVVGDSRAVQIDPQTHQIQSYDGLDSAYTYSDMTGWALKNVTEPPEG